MKTLIIPDLHLHWKSADRVINTTEHDEIVFLGDFFDDFGDNPEMIQDMCDWLEVSVSRPNRTHIFGNHDLHYAFAHKHFQCSGYDQWKYFLIHDRFDGSHVWDKFKHYHVLDGTWLLTHAGLHNHWVPKPLLDMRTDRPKFLKELSDYLDQEIIKGFRKDGWIFEAGHARGGFQRVGGISWCDYTHEFYPVKGLNQICGHTPQEWGAAKWTYLKGNSKVTWHPYNLWTPQTFDDPERSINICLDVWKNFHWAVWDSKAKELKVFNRKDFPDSP